MKRNPSTKDSGWDISFWFAVSSPLLGVLLGVLAAAIFLSMMEEAMSRTPIIFVLVILLFGFDLAGQVKTRRKNNYG